VPLRYQASAVYRSKLDRIKEEMKYYSVPWGLQNRVLAYYDYMWVNQKQYDDKITLLTDKGMSSDLRGKLALHLYKEVVQGVSLFSRVDDTFLSKVCMELQTRVFLPQDWIILKGDIGSELYIISRGVCQVFLRDPWEQRASKDEEADQEILLSNGQFFGEISLLMEVRRTTSVQAKTICEVNVLVQEIFEEILRESPDFADEMKSLIVQRKVENFKKLNHETPTEMDQEMIEDAVTEAIESRQLTIGGDRGVGDVQEDENENENDDFFENQPDYVPLPGMMEEDDEEHFDDTIKFIKVKKSKEGGVKIMGTMEEEGGMEKKVSNKGVDVSVRRLSQQARSPSGLALGNMAGAGFIPRKQQGAVENKMAENRFAVALLAQAEGETGQQKKTEKKTEGGGVEMQHLDEDRQEALLNKAGSLPSGNSGRGADAAPRLSGSAQHTKPAGSKRNMVRQFSRHDAAAGAAGQGFAGGEGSVMHAEMDDLVSQQLALLQERIDKIYAMLTSKLGRVR